MKKSRLINASESLKRFRKGLLIMKCCIALNMVLCIDASAMVRSQTEKISLNLHNVGMEQFIDAVKEQTELRFMYNSELIRNTAKVSVTVNDADLNEVLTMVLEKAGLEYEMFNDVILIRGRSGEGIQQQPPQQRIVTGTVRDAAGNPLMGATVMVKGETRGANTDATGRYSITIPATGSPVLVYTYLGKITQEITYNGQATLDVTMKESVSKLEGVVVTGYFTRARESYTGAATTFKGEELRKISTGNILSTLSTLDPSFVQIVNNEMGSDPNHIPDFEIRGSSSLKAEYEGNPNIPTFIIDGFEVSAQKVFDLDPNRVRSVTILKDAAATAIYGSRAANGVVVIETESPKMGKLLLSYNGSVDFEVADLSGYDLMNAEEKLQYEVYSGLYSINGASPSIAEGRLLEYNEILKLVKQGIDIDWLSIPVRELAIGHKHTIMAEGGDENFRYAIDAFYSNRAGAMKGSNRETYGGGIRLQYNWKNLRFNNYTSFDHLKSVNSPYGTFSDYLYYNPYYNPYDEDGNIKKILYQYSYFDRQVEYKAMVNELYNAVLPSKSQSTGNYFLNNLSIEYDFSSELRLKTNLSISIDNDRSDTYKPYDHTDFADSEKKGSYSQTFSNGFTYDLNATLSYNKNIDKHFINSSFIWSIRESTSDSSSMTAVGFPNANMDHISMAAEFSEGTKPGGSYLITRMASLMGNANYTYDNRFLLDLSLRLDGSSVYGSNNRWGKFWSVGVGWNLHHEEFLKHSTAINVLKIRASTGITGDQKFNPYQSMAMYSYNITSAYSYADYIGAVLMAFGNENLKWQQTYKHNVGLDFELFNRRVSGSFNLYKEISNDVLIDVSIAPSLGFSSYKENLGKVQNSGYELSLRGGIIRDTERRLRWDVTFNMNHNKNKLMEINDALTAFNERQDQNVTTAPVIRYQEGMSINTIWVNESLGIDPATGLEVFRTLDGNKTTEWSSDNLVPYHSQDPNIFGTVGTVFAYGNWELNAHMYYTQGGYIYNQTLVDKVENVNPNENGDRRILYDRWKEPGDIAKYRKLSSVKTLTQPTSRFVEKNDYIQLKSLSISYDMGARGLERLGVSRLRISAITNDLFTVSTVRMERGTTYPFARTYSLSMKLTF